MILCFLEGSVATMRSRKHGKSGTHGLRMSPTDPSHVPSHEATCVIACSNYVYIYIYIHMQSIHKWCLNQPKSVLAYRIMD